MLIQVKTVFIALTLCIVAVQFRATAFAEPTAEQTVTVAEQAADAAAAMIGIPYRYGGEGPDTFDCSGLVRYSFGLAGIETPHGTRALRRISTRVTGDDMKKGDLLFFNERKRRSSHVGIYFGDGLFVHAPRRHESVRVDNLGDTHWKRRFSEVRRIS